MPMMSAGANGGRKAPRHQVRNIIDATIKIKVSAVDSSSAPASSFHHIPDYLYMHQWYYLPSL